MSWVCHIRLGTSSAQPKEPRVPLAPHDSLVNPPLCVPSISMRDAEILSPACWGEAASGFFSSTGSAAWVGPSTSISTRIHAQRSAAPISLCDLCAKFCHTALIRSVTIVNPSEDARGKRHKKHPPMNAKVLCVNRCSMILRSRIPMDQNPHKPFVAVINAYECCF